jgi:hypothetical protein
MGQVSVTSYVKLDESDLYFCDTPEIETQSLTRDEDSGDFGDQERFLQLKYWPSV